MQIKLMFDSVASTLPGLAYYELGVVKNLTMRGNVVRIFYVSYHAIKDHLFYNF